MRALCVCVAEDKEGMETAGGAELHRPALVPALHRLLRGHGELLPSDHITDHSIDH